MVNEKEKGVGGRRRVLHKALIAHIGILGYFSFLFFQRTVFCIEINAPKIRSGRTVPIWEQKDFSYTDI